MSGKSTGPATDEKFIEVWNSAGSPARAAARLRITVAYAKTRAYRLRCRGHDLKNYHNYHRPSGSRSPGPLVGKRYAEEINSGLTAREVARRNGVSHHAVTTSVRRAGYDVRHDKVTGKTRAVWRGRNKVT